MKKKAALCSGMNEENEIAIGKFLTHFSHNSPIATLRMQMPVEAIIRRAYTSIISQGCRALTSCVCLYRQKRKKPGTDTQANTTQSAAKSTRCMPKFIVVVCTALRAQMATEVEQTPWIIKCRDSRPLVHLCQSRAGVREQCQSPCVSFILGLELNAVAIMLLSLLGKLN